MPSEAATALPAAEPKAAAAEAGMSRGGEPAPALPARPPIELPEAAAQALTDPAAATPSGVGRQFNALPPSAQAERYANLGTTLDKAIAGKAASTQNSLPTLTATLDGETASPQTTEITTPVPAPSTAAASYALTPDPIIDIPAAPEPAAVSKPALPAAESVDAGALDQALESATPAPVIETSLEPPAIPLEGTTDPAALDGLERAASSEAGGLLAEAKAGITAVSPEMVQPIALGEAVVTPPLPAIPPIDQAPVVPGMDQLAGYGLSPLDKAAFDGQVGPSMQVAVAGAEAELAQREQSFTAERTALHAAAEADAAAAGSEARASQQETINQGRAELTREQQNTLDQQQTAVDGALGDLAVSKQTSMQAVDQRLAQDRAEIDGIYATAEADAKAEVELGKAEVADTEKNAAKEAEGDSWWDWAIDAYQSFIQTLSTWIAAIWEKVNQAVAGILDLGIRLATAVVSAGVAFIKEAISGYFRLWAFLVDNLLGSLFPELAAAFRAFLDDLKSKLFAALDWVATKYLQALRFIADALVQALAFALELYKAGVASWLALWEQIQNGQWADIGYTLLGAMLAAVGIDPTAFFATFGKIGEVIDDVIADPTLIGKRAINALSLGFKQFGTNFIGNFTTAFVEWITGAAALVLPKTFSLAGIFDVTCQILNLTYDYLREKAVQHLGEGAVTAVEELTSTVWTFVKDGWSGLWNLVKDKVTTLVDDVVIAAGTWIVEKAILVAGRWIVGLIATMGWSAIIEGLIALWQFAMWIKDQFQRFWQIIESTVDSVHDFVKGNIQPAADRIEGTLQNMIIPAIDLVAKLLNLGNIAKKVEQIIESVRKMVDDAIEGVIEAVKKKLGFGKKEEKGKKDEEENELSARHGKITLATLNEPPVKMPRTKEEELQDLDAAQKVLKLAEAKVEDTAQLSEYFAPMKDHFRLKDIGYDMTKREVGVLMKINPEKRLDPAQLLVTAVQSDAIHRDLGSADTEIQWRERSVSQLFHRGSSAFKANTSSEKVGVTMIADPLGPDHPQGSATKTPDVAQANLMEWLRPSDQDYVRGHLLNHWVGGPGRGEVAEKNLFPITLQANNKMKDTVEKDVRRLVNNNRYYVFYGINIDLIDHQFQIDNSVSPPAPAATNFVSSRITAQVGILTTHDNKLANEHFVVIDSSASVDSDQILSDQDKRLDIDPQYQGIDDLKQHSEEITPSIPLGEANPWAERIEVAADITKRYKELMYVINQNIVLLRPNFVSRIIFQLCNYFQPWENEIARRVKIADGFIRDFKTQTDQGQAFSANAEENAVSAASEFQKFIVHFSSSLDSDQNSEIVSKFLDDFVRKHDSLDKQARDFLSLVDTYPGDAKVREIYQFIVKMAGVNYLPFKLGLRDYLTYQKIVKTVRTDIGIHPKRLENAIENMQVMSSQPLMVSDEKRIAFQNSLENIVRTAQSEQMNFTVLNNLIQITNDHISDIVEEIDARKKDIEKAGSRIIAYSDGNSLFDKHKGII